MTAILERLQRLLALAESPNDNEARNAALLAVRLIKQHGVKLALPTEPPTSTPRRPSPSAGTRRRTPVSGRTKRVADVPAPIVSPLGGDCIECGTRYRAGSSIYWLESGGGLHTRCLAAWMKRKG
jgi:hypothetical protein